MSTSHLPPKLFSGALHTKRKAKITLLVAFTALGLGFVPFVKIYDDGLPPLAVTVRSAAGDPIIAASGQAFGDATAAAYVLEHLAPPESIFSAT